MAKYVVVAGCDFIEEVLDLVEGDFESEEEAIEAFGGEDALWQEAIQYSNPYCFLREATNDEIEEFEE